MSPLRAAIGTFVVSLGIVLPAAGQPLRVGILPFDIVNAEGSTEKFSDALAKLVRIRMIKDKQFRPILLSLPEKAEPPLESAQIAEIARTAEVDVVLVGTVLEASTSRSDRSASTGGAFGISVGGRITRTSATVALNIELADPASGETLETFEVEGSDSSTGVGADLWTTLGDIDTGTGDSDKSPMGKALREAADKLVAEVGKRGRKFTRK